MGGTGSARGRQRLRPDGRQRLRADGRQRLRADARQRLRHGWAPAPPRAGASAGCPPRGGVSPLQSWDCRRTTRMAATDAITVDAAGRDVRVTSPERVIFPATERMAALTKLDIVEYYLAVDDGIMRALRQRPTTLERWPKGVHPGMVISTRDWSGGDAFFQKRIPKGAPDYLQTAR